MWKIKRIEATEGRSGTRKPADQLCFEHAVHIILTDLWQSVKCIPMRECRISKRSGHYFKNPQYSDPLLTPSILNDESGAASRGYDATPRSGIN